MDIIANSKIGVEFQELLAEKDVYVDGSGIEQSGFRYDHPYINLTLLKEVSVNFNLEQTIYRYLRTLNMFMVININNIDNINNIGY